MSRIFRLVSVGLLLLALLMVMGAVVAAQRVLCEFVIEGEVVTADCVVVTPTSSPTATASNTPTATGTPGATETPVPSVTPTKVAEITPGVELTPWAGAPACEEHDAEEWHSLWNGKLGCHYDHTHGHDPAAADVVAVFGKLDFTFVRAWQTVNENRNKHEGNFCVAALGLPIVPRWELNWTTNIAAGIRDIFACIHFHPTHLDGVVRVHSFEMWQRHCNRISATEWGEDCGFAYLGGHVNTGIAHCNYKERHCPMWTDPVPIPGWQWIPGTGTSGKSIDPYRAHFRSCNEVMSRLRQNPDGWLRGASLAFVDNNRDNPVLWSSLPGAYGYNWHGGFAVFSFDNVTCIDYEKGLAAGEPGSVAFTQAIAVDMCEGRRAAGLPCRFDGSVFSLVNAFTIVKPGWDNGAMDRNPAKGRVTMDAYTNVYGEIAPSCDSPGANCVPFVLKDAYVGQHAFNFTQTAFPNGKGPWMEDFDLSPGGEYWISAYRPHEH